jgi:hypothetical protein
MSHRHYCEVTGHDWQCSSPECECICGSRMEEGDHCECPVELRPCAEHEEDWKQGFEQLKGTIFEPMIGFPPHVEIPQCQCGCAGVQGEAFCVWCSHEYAEYTAEAENQHFAHHCPEAPEELKESARARLAKHLPLDAASQESKKEKGKWTS